MNMLFKSTRNIIVLLLIYGGSVALSILFLWNLFSFLGWIGLIGFFAIFALLFRMLINTAIKG